jgi:hypothetical protein
MDFTAGWVVLRTLYGEEVPLAIHQKQMSVVAGMCLNRSLGQWPQEKIHSSCSEIPVFRFSHVTQGQNTSGLPTLHFQEM